MMSIVLRGRGLVKGKAEGEAVVSSQPISFIGGVDPNTGIVIEKGHELEGCDIKGKVLVFPFGKGTTYNPFAIFAMKKRGTGPVAIINVKTEEIVLTGAILAEIPFIDSLDRDPLEVIESGDYVKVDGETGIVEVIKRRKT
ncbi:MAG: aconitase X swivel domain-containing protein [Candidatus Freyarchaeota archaeon]